MIASRQLQVVCPLENLKNHRTAILDIRRRHMKCQQMTESIYGDMNFRTLAPFISVLF